MPEECITEIKGELIEARNSITHLEKRLKEQDKKHEQQQFRLSNMIKDDLKIAFFTGFPSYGSLSLFTSIWGQVSIICVIHQSRVTVISKVAASGVVKEHCLRWKRCSLHWCVFD
jgi:hypothetical protein